MASFSDIRIPESLLGELAEVERLAREGRAVVPPPRFVALFVKHQRGILGWKQRALASFANVSLSTVERIERAEAVSAVSLDRVAVALGQQPGAFSEPRFLATGRELEQRIEDSTAIFRDKMWVPVRPLRTQPQVASLARTLVKMVDRTRLGDEFMEEGEALIETIDVIGFSLMMEEQGSSAQSEPLKRRELYALVLDQVKAIEKRGHAVALAGTYKASSNWSLFPEVEIGTIVFFPLSCDPGAIKRSGILVPTSVDLVGMWQRFCSEAA